MTCPSCLDLMPDCERVAYRGICESCYVDILVNCRVVKRLSFAHRSGTGDSGKPGNRQWSAVFQEVQR